MELVVQQCPVDSAGEKEVETLRQTTTLRDDMSVRRIKNVKTFFANSYVRKCECEPGPTYAEDVGYCEMLSQSCRRRWKSRRR